MSAAEGYITEAESAEGSIVAVIIVTAVVKVRGARGGSAPCFDFGGVWPPC